MAKKSIENLDNLLTNIGYGKYQFLVFISTISLASSTGSEYILTNLFQEYLISHLDYSTTLATIIVTLINSGQIFGNFVTYVLSDNFGRLFMLQVSLVLTVVFGLLSAAIARNIITFAIFRGISGFGVGLSMTNTFSYMIENSPNYNRGLFTVSFMLFTIIGQIVAILIAYLFMSGVDGSNWELTFSLNFLMYLLSVVPLFFFLEESPWCLIKKNKTEECINVVDKISKSNTGVGLTEDEKESLRGIEFREIVNKNMIFGKRYLSKTLTFTWLVAYVNIGIAWPHYLIPMAVDGDEYFIITALSISFSLLFYVITSVTIETNVFGRKYSCFLCLSTLGIGGIVGILLPINSFYFGVFISVIYGIAYSGYVVIRLFLLEMYETEIRTTAQSIVLLCSRVHMIYFPIVYVLITSDPKYSLIFFGAGGVISCVLMFIFSQDTLGKHLDYEYN